MRIPSQFTEEANRLIESEGERLAIKLREEAIEEALRSRGEPVEVTATDVRRASMRFTKQSSSLSHRLDFVFRVYLFLGIMTFLFGLGRLVFPYLKSLYETDPSTRLSFITLSFGLLVTVISALVLWFRRISGLLRGTSDSLRSFIEGRRY